MIQHGNSDHFACGNEAMGDSIVLRAGFAVPAGMVVGYEDARRPGKKRGAKDFPRMHEATREGSSTDFVDGLNAMPPV
jgi:hypothetical protein